MRAIGMFGTISIVGLAVGLALPAEAAKKHKGKDIGAIRAQCREETGHGGRPNPAEFSACVTRKMHGG